MCIPPFFCASQMLVNFLTTVCANRPRAKRKLARSLDSWREVYDEVRIIIEYIVFGWRWLISSGTCLNQAERLQSPLVNRLSDFPTISLIPLSIEFVILQIAIESLLSGFDLDIYEPREMGSIYWTACRFLRAIVRVLEELSRGEASLMYLGFCLDRGRLMACASCSVYFQLLRTLKDLL